MKSTQKTCNSGHPTQTDSENAQPQSVSFQLLKTGTAIQQGNAVLLNMALA